MAKKESASCAGARGDAHMSASEADGPDNTDAATHRPADPFTVARAAWLRDINADRRPTKLSMGVAYYISDFSSVRIEGCSWPSIGMIARNTGASESAVEDALARLARYGYLRIESRRAQRKPSLLWLAFVRDVSAPSWGKASPKTADAASMKSADVISDGGGQEPASKSALLLGDITTFDREHPRKLQTSLLTESSNRVISTTTLSSLQANESALEKDNDQILLEEIAMLHGQLLSRNVMKRWRGDLFTFRVRGIDPRRNLLPAIQHALIDAGKKGKDKLTPTTTLLRFEIPATELKENFDLQCAEAVQHWLGLFAKESAAVVASRQPPAPKAPATKRSKADYERRDLIRNRAIHAFGIWHSGTCPWLIDQIEGFEARGHHIDEIIAAIANAKDMGRVPTRLEMLRRAGGLPWLLRGLL